MPVTVDDLRKIASLAHLRIEPERERETAARMEELIGFVRELGPADRASGPPAGAARAVSEAPDEPEPGLPRDVVLDNAPARRRGHVRMPPLGPTRGGAPAGLAVEAEAERTTATAGAGMGPDRSHRLEGPDPIAGERADGAQPAWMLSAAEVAEQVRSGARSARQVVAACLDRIECLEPTLGAYVEVDRQGALARADEIDRAIGRTGASGRAGDRVARPLLGVPVAIKDNLCVAGWPLTCGSRILEGFVAPVSATVVERLLAAGAVPVGRTNLDELAMGSSCETSMASRRRPTRNPWDLSRVPGGSSGGSAATVASSAVPLALGSDTGGSVRQPAALCGVVGLRPTWGRVSRRGLVAFASSLDQVGPIARTVEDVALALAAIAGPDPGDATCAERGIDDLRAALERHDRLNRLEGGIEGWRIGTLGALGRGSRVPGEAAAFGETSPAMRAAFDAALELLAAAGAEIVEVSVPSIGSSLAAYAILAAAEASSNLARFDGVRFGRRAPREAGQSAAEAIEASRSAGFGDEVTRRILLGTFALSAGYAERFYGRAQELRTALRGELEAAFGRVDLLATPTAPTGAFRLGERLGDPVAMARSDVFTAPAALAGVPAISLPCGLDPDGLPLGLQLMAPAFAEGRLLRAARAAERLFAFERPLLPRSPKVPESPLRPRSAEASRLSSRAEAA